MTPRWLALAASVTVLAAICPAAALAADQAIVVGVNHYPGLQGDNGEPANLMGCVNDAGAMADTLRKYGFRVTLLKDEQATRSGILNAIKAAAAKSNQKDRFVFYFAGHGAEGFNRDASILPTDAKESGDHNVISAAALNGAVKAVPARSWSVVLDSCFSGGMSRGLNGFAHPHRLSRYYRWRGAKDLFIPANHQDSNSDLDRGSGVCYFTASDGNEPSLEDDFDGTRDGVFTHFLTQELTGQLVPWGEVQSRVAGEVADFVQDKQHPTLSPDYVSALLWGGGSDTPRPPDLHGSLWDVYNSSHADKGRVDLTVTPNQTEFVRELDQIGFVVQVNAGTEDYLVILERGASGKINLLFPASRSIEDARVTGQVTVLIPSTNPHYYLADQSGTERVKAILFDSREWAKTLLDPFRDANSMSREAFKKNLQQVREVYPTSESGAVGYYTSEVSIEIVDGGQ